MYYSSENKFEIGVDEAGRGPMFGRLYVAAVILPNVLNSNDNTNKLTEIYKDSKKIKSKKKMEILSNHIKEHSIAWSVKYIEHDEIDDINILQAVYKGMHACIKECIEKIDINVFEDKTLLLIDGNSFKPYTVFENDRLYTVPYETIEGGDNKFQSISAASILAKHARDEYIKEKCIEYPLLSERYSIDKNMGYGTKAHLQGIEKYGVTQWHRKSFGICKHVGDNFL